MADLYSSILVPIELDDPLLVVLAFAKQLAVDRHATLHLLHVVPTLPSFGEPNVSENEHSPAEEKAHGLLDEIAKAHLEGSQYQIHTASAVPRALGKAIVRVAGEVEANLIVLKTHGRRGLSRFILGSVAEEILHTAPCAVLTFSPEAQEKAARADSGTEVRGA